MARTRRIAKEVRYIVDHTTGCWIWQLSVGTSGYGQLCIGGKKMVAHRFYYVQAKGEIPEQLKLDHLCRNKRCVNPAHLEPVTDAENTRRGLSTILTISQVQEIKRRINSEELKSLAQEYNVAPSTISAIKNGYNWRT